VVFRQSNTHVRGEKVVKTCKNHAKVRKNSTKSVKKLTKIDKIRQKLTFFAGTCVND
jgi:hypothetical protein